VVRPFVWFAMTEQILGQLLARPQAREDDVDLPGRARGQASCDVGDPYLFPHVQHQRLAAAADDGRLQDQLDRFVRGHEITTDLRMRHGYRATGRDLRGQGGEYGSAAAEHIPEAHAEVSPGCLASHVRGEPLRDSFGVAQDARRVRRLVR